jgi:hypothetical protein
MATLIMVVVACVGIAFGGAIGWRTRRLGRVFGRSGGRLSYEFANVLVVLGLLIILFAFIRAMTSGEPRAVADRAFNIALDVGIGLSMLGAFAAGWTRPSKGSVARRKRKQQHDRKFVDRSRENRGE